MDGHGETQQRLRDVFAYVDARSDESVEHLRAMVRQPSISSTGEGIAAAAAQLEAFMGGCGLDTRLLEAGGNPAVYGERLERAGAPTVLVYGHYDVQPVEPLDAWTHPPFEPVVAGGRVYGRGSSDNKGQHLAQLLALRATLACHGRLPVNVKLLVEGEEEVSSPTLPAIAALHRDLLAADLAYVSDGPVYTGERPMVALGCRGLLLVALRLATGRGDLHSGAYGGQVQGAALRLARALQALAATAGGEGGWLEAGMRPLAPGELAALDRLDQWAAGEGVDGPAAAPGPGAPARAGPDFRAALAPSLNVSGLSSGYTGPGVKTVIPGEATARLDLRLVAGQRPDELLTLLTGALAAIDPLVEVTALGAVPPARAPADLPAVGVVAGALEAAWEAPALLVPSIGGTLPQYVFEDVLGVPALLVPYANVDQANHAPDENLRIDCFVRGIKSFSAVMEHLAGLPR